MIHMLSAFDLAEGEDLETFRQAYAVFVQDLRAADLIVEAGSIGRRVANTPMDTDDNRGQQLYSILSFRDREQLDVAYAKIAGKIRPGTASHINMYARITNAVFTCWQDLD